MQSEHLIALSVLAAGAMIGAGLYFGLRAQAPAAPTMPTSAAPTEVPVPTSPTIEVAPTPPSPNAQPQTSTSPLTSPLASPPLAAPAHVTAEVRAALDRLRPALAKACWAPSAAKAREPASLGFDYRIGIGPQGNVVVFGYQDVTVASRADVARCLREQKPDFTVTPPGSSVVVTGTLTLP